MSRKAVSDGQRKQAAIENLQAIIRSKYPTATFSIQKGIEDPEETWIVARGDIDDPDEVVDVVIDRVLEYQLDQGLPVYVLPLRTPERIATLLSRTGKERRPAAVVPRAKPSARRTLHP